MRLSCLPQQLVRSSEQLLLMDRKKVLLVPDLDGLDILTAIFGPSFGVQMFQSFQLQGASYPMTWALPLDPAGGFAPRHPL